MAVYYMYMPFSLHRREGCSALMEKCEVAEAFCKGKIPQVIHSSKGESSRENRPNELLCGARSMNTETGLRGHADLLVIPVSLLELWRIGIQIHYPSVPLENQLIKWCYL